MVEELDGNRDDPVDDFANGFFLSFEESANKEVELELVGAADLNGLDYLLLVNSPEELEAGFFAKRDISLFMVY